jgi:hypothetical protein
MKYSTKWHTEKRKLSQLTPYQYNPRIMTEKEAMRLKTSLDKHGYVEIIAINEDNVIVAGNQRYQLLLQELGGDYTIEVRVPDHLLTQAEFTDYLLDSNKISGEWDYDLLASIFDAEDLIAKGFTESELGFDFDEDVSKDGYKITIDVLNDDVVKCKKLLDNAKVKYKIKRWKVKDERRR